MATVSSVMLEYGARGADKVARADRKVRSSVQETAQTARKSEGAINRWLERSKTSLQMLSIAAAGALGAIISASPTMRAELASARIAFTLFADTVVNDVLPAGRGVADVAFELQQRYEELDPAVRKVTSGLILFGGILGGIAVAASGFAALIVGAFAAQITVLAAVLDQFGALESVMSAWMNMGRAVVTFLTGDFAGAWNLLKAAFWDFVDAGTTILRTIYEAVVGWLGKAKDRALVLVSDLRDGVIRRWNSLKRRTAEWFKSVYETVKNRLGSLRDDALGWGQDVIDRFIRGIRSRIGAVRNAVSEIRSAVESRISFDIRANDRMAERWGEDMMDYFARGMDTGRPQIQQTLQSAVQKPMSGATGGPTITGGVTVEVNLESTGNSRADGREIGKEASKHIIDELEARR